MSTVILRAVAILAVLIVGIPAEASVRRECRRKCKQAITACVTNTAQRRRKCRRLMLRQCRREGIAVCVPPTTSTTSTTLRSGCFQDWGDGTIRDTCTGLQWEKKNASDGTPNAANLHDVDNPYSWAGYCTSSPADLCQPNAAAAATCMALSDGGTTGCTTCGSGTCNVDPRGYGAITTVWDWLNQVNAANFAGHSDWRLPSEGGCNSCWSGVSYSCSNCDPHELERLAQYPCGLSSCINPIFGPTASAYWSASTDAADPASAWIAGGTASFAISYPKSLPRVYPFEATNVRAVW